MTSEPQGNQVFISDPQLRLDFIKGVSEDSIDFCDPKWDSILSSTWLSYGQFPTVYTIADFIGMSDMQSCFDEELDLKTQIEIADWLEWQTTSNKEEHHESTHDR